MITPRLLDSFPEPSPAAVQHELLRLGLTTQAAAELLRINHRTMQRYLQPPGTPSATPCPFPAFALLRTLNTAFSLSAPMVVTPISDV